MGESGVSRHDATAMRACGELPDGRQPCGAGDLTASDAQLSLVIHANRSSAWPNASGMPLTSACTAAGIPKFYRWLSERYPLVNQPVGVAAIPEFDALYLDMNGIIHNCTHGNDPSTKLTEAEMVVRTFNYLDRLVQIAKPQQLLFMAIDGARRMDRALACACQS